MKKETKLFIRDAHWALQQTALLLLTGLSVFATWYNLSLLSAALDPKFPGQPSAGYVGEVMGNILFALMLGIGCFVWYRIRKRNYDRDRKKEDDDVQV